MAFRAKNDGLATGTCSTTTFTISTTGFVNGDTLVLTVNLEQSCCGAPSNVSTPTGWVRQNFSSAYTTNTSAALFTCANFISGTTGLTFTVTEAGVPTTVNWTWGVSAYTGLQATPIDVTPTVQTNASSTNLTAPSITTVTNGCIIINAYCYNGTGTITDAGGTTSRINRQASAGSVYQADQVQSSAGATGTIIATIVGAKVSRAYSIALRAISSSSGNSIWFGADV